ncbi:MAG TPA: hypothetical protein VGI76_01565 [Solirubrobacteraceae bacterium]
MPAWPALCGNQRRQLVEHPPDAKALAVLCEVGKADAAKPF